MIEYKHITRMYKSVKNTQLWRQCLKKHGGAVNLKWLQVGKMKLTTQQG